MQEGAKRRLVGAVVIVALAVIFVPMLFEDDSLAPPESQALLPDEPGLDDRFDSDGNLPLADPLTDGMTDGGRVESEPLGLPASPSLPPTESLLDGAEPGQLGAVDAPSPMQSPSEPPPAETRRPTAQRPTAAPARPAASPKTETPAAPVPPKPASTGNLPSWVVQVASLGSSASANELAGKLKGAGFTAFVEQAEVRGKLFYRVRVGPEVDRDAAERTAAALRRKQKLETLIQRYQ